MKRQIFDKPSTRLHRLALRKRQTVPEKLLWSKIRNRQLSNIKFRKQYGIGEYIADFYSAEIKLVVEVDGSSHFSEEARKYDAVRTKFMESLELKVIRFTNDEVLGNIDSVLARIVEVGQERKAKSLSP